MDLATATTAFALLFFAEVGDKTQLATIALAQSYPVRPVIAGVFSAFFLLNLLAVLVGEALYRVMPEPLVLAGAGALFLLFAWHSWRESGQEEETAVTSERGAFVVSFGLIFAAELGDKTQLALVALAASTGALWSTFIGATLALWSVAAIGVFVGSRLLRGVPRALIHRLAAVLFALFSILTLGRLMLG